MKLRPALACGVAAAAMFATTSSAAPAPQVVDAPGDANAVNGQGVVEDGPLAGSPGPGSQDSQDILSVTFETTKANGVCTGFTASAEYKGKPGADHSMYRVESTTAASPTFLLLQFQRDPQYGDRTSVRVAGGDAGAKTVVTEKPVTVLENKIVWTISLKDLAAVGESGKTNMEALGASSQANLGGAAYLPIFDLARSDKSFKVCG